LSFVFDATASSVAVITAPFPAKPRRAQRPGPEHRYYTVPHLPPVRCALSQLCGFGQ
jgi:hypothetical protein